MIASSTISTVIGANWAIFDISVECYRHAVAGVATDGSIAGAWVCEAAETQHNNLSKKARGRSASGASQQIDRA